MMFPRAEGPRVFIHSSVDGVSVFDTWDLLEVMIL